MLRQKQLCYLPSGSKAGGDRDHRGSGVHRRGNGSADNTGTALVEDSVVSRRAADPGTVVP